MNTLIINALKKFNMDKILNIRKQDSENFFILIMIIYEKSTEKLYLIIKYSL